MNVMLNGTPVNTHHQNVLALLEEQGLTHGRFAVEIDGRLIPKAHLADTVITDGLKIEVVQAVGGG